MLACMTLAEAVGPTRCEVELLPQCWEQVRWGMVSSLYALCCTPSCKLPSIFFFCVLAGLANGWALCADYTQVP